MMLEHGGNRETWGSGVAEILRYQPLYIIFWRMLSPSLLPSLVRKRYGDLAHGGIQQLPRRACKSILEDGVGQANRDPKDFLAMYRFSRL